VDLHVYPADYWTDSDPILLYRIVANLVDNAIKHAAATRVLVGARRRSDGLAIEVRDNGCGIPIEQQQQIFHEFVQLQRTDQRRPPGMGLGLSVVQRLSLLLQHPVALRSRPSAGTCFSVSVPRTKPREHCRSQQAPERTAAHSLSGKSVLLVDDDPTVRQATAQLLAAWQCDVRSAADRDQALQIASEERIDLIIADYRFPDAYTGLDLIAALDEQAGKPYPAIIITGEVDPSILDRLRASPYPVLSKPVAPMQLRSALHRLSVMNSKA
jgi:CheY-like chemotaxis protein